MQKNNSPHRISTEITSEKIKIMNDIDLNALFNLNYNFDLLKGIIEQLLKNQNALQNQIDELYGINGDKDKRIENLEKEVKFLKETYVDKSQLKEIKTDLEAIKEHLKKHDQQIEDSKTKINLYFYSFKQIKIGRK
jgi:predicted  nucleic acid-binding Zn-ribbon protein